MKTGWAFLTWCFLVLAILTQHELAHAALQKAYDQDSVIVSVTVLGLGGPPCSQPAYGAWNLGCMTYRGKTGSTTHVLLEQTWYMFQVVMVTYPLTCYAIFYTKKVLEHELPHT